MIDIKVPSVGESVSSGILAVWLKKDGDFVREGDELFELETDKATMAIPAPAAGQLKILVVEGTEVDIGASVATIDETATGSVEAQSTPATASAKADSPLSPVAAQAPAQAAQAPTQPAQAAQTPVTPAAPAGPDEDLLLDLSPAVRKLVLENALDPRKIKGTGPSGRILKEDVLAVIAGRSASPSLAPAAALASTAGATAPLSQAPPSLTGGRGERRIPMTPIRKKIAERLVASKQGAAHLSTFNEVDMSTIMSLRSTHKDAFEKKYGVRLGFMSFFIKAAQNALQAIPEVNAYIEGTDIIYHDYVDIGVAMSTERGLITPVIRNVETLNFADIEAAIVQYADKAKSKKIMPDDLMGGTFTISNGGVFGSLLSTPIPNPPQTAVLGMHSIQERPVVVNGQIVARPMMYLALTYDHRMLDGKGAIGFLKLIKDQIEDPARMLLDL